MPVFCCLVGLFGVLCVSFFLLALCFLIFLNPFLFFFCAEESTVRNGKINLIWEGVEVLKAISHVAEAKLSLPCVRTHSDNTCNYFCAIPCMLREQYFILKSFI